MGNWKGNVRITLKSALGTTATAQSRVALTHTIYSAIPPCTAVYPGPAAVYGGPAFVVGGPRKERGSGS